MLTIKKTGEGYYLVALTVHKEDLSKNDCKLMKQELLEVIKPHREISINIKGIKKIDSSGFNSLIELKDIADLNKCKLRFINIEPSMALRITKLITKKTQQPN